MNGHRGGDGLEDALNEISHPFGQHAFVEAARRKPPPAAREVVGYEEVVGAAESPAPAAAKPKGKKRRAGAAAPGAPEFSVGLPRWMDLDAETRSGAPMSLTTGQGLPSEAQKPRVAKKVKQKLNAKLDDFGGAGELTVQMRTARGPRTDDFDTLLSSHVSAKERAEQPKGERRPEQPPKGYVCNCCGIEGHWIFNCPTAGTGGPPGDYVCHLCGIAGHWRNECPHNIHNKVEENKYERATARAERRVERHAVPPPNYRCAACNECGAHWVDECPMRGTAAARAQRGAPPPGYICHRCKQAGHWIDECELAPRRDGERYSGGGGGGDLELTEDDMEAGLEIAEAVEEEAPEVVAVVQRAVAALGEERMRGFLVQTWQIEEGGGLLTIDGSNRRRSSGGVLLWLIKQGATAAQRKAIWPEGTGPQRKRAPAGGGWGDWGDGAGHAATGATAAGGRGTGGRGRGRPPGSGRGGKKKAAAAAAAAGDAAAGGDDAATSEMSDAAQDAMAAEMEAILDRASEARR